MLAKDASAFSPESPAMAEESIVVLFLYGLDIHVYHFVNKNFSKVFFVPDDTSTNRYSAFLLAVSCLPPAVSAIGRVVLARERELTRVELAIEV